MSIKLPDFECLINDDWELFEFLALLDRGMVQKKGDRANNGTSADKGLEYWKT